MNKKIKSMQIFIQNNYLFIKYSKIVFFILKKNTRTIWNDPERSGTIWNDLERSGTIWNDLERSGTIRNDLERSGTIRNDPERSGTIRNDLERSGTIWNLNVQERSGTFVERSAREVMNDRYCISVS